MTNKTDQEVGPTLSPPPFEVPNGLYILRNKRTKTCLDLDCGPHHIGSRIQGWSRFSTWLPNSLWFIEKQASGGYVIRNARTGKVMDLDNGKADNGTRVQGYQFIFSNPNQSWDLVDKGGYYSIQNAKTKTCLELKDGSLDNGAQAQCINYVEGDDNQLWFLDRRSRTPNEIQYVLQANRLLFDLFEPSNDNGTQYLILPSRLREDIYTSSGLDKSIRRPGVFDYENFVIKSKDAMASWVRDNIALDGCGALFGIVYGSLRGGRYSYNWTLTKDCQSVVFFDAYTGDELTTTSLEQLGFQPRFGTF